MPTFASITKKLLGCLKLTYHQEPDFRVIYSKKELTLKNSSQKVYRSYLFGYQSCEKLNELHGEGNAYSFEYRIQDPRIGRFLSLDPLQAQYPFYSPYQFAGNTPIACKDIEGLEPKTMVDDYGWLTEPVVGLLNAAFGFNEANLRNTQYHAINFPFGGITIYQDVYFDVSVSGKDNTWWFSFIAHEQKHRSEIGNNQLQAMGWYLIYGVGYMDKLLDPTTKDAYYENPAEVRGYAIDALGVELWRYQDKIVNKVLNSSYTTSEQTQALKWIGYNFAYKKANESLGAINTEIQNKQNALSTTSIKSEQKTLKREINQLTKLSNKVQKQMHKIEEKFKKVDDAATRDIVKDVQ